MENKSGRQAGFVRNNSFQNDLMILQTSTGKVRALGSLRGVIDLETPPYKRFSCLWDSEPRQLTD